MFYELCDEIHDIDCAEALQQLVGLLEDALKMSSKKVRNIIKRQLMQWIAGLPNYTKAYLPVLTYES